MISKVAWCVLISFADLTRTYMCISRVITHTHTVCHFMSPKEENKNTCKYLGHALLSTTTKKTITTLFSSLIVSFFFFFVLCVQKDFLNEKRDKKKTELTIETPNSYAGRRTHGHF